MSPGKRGWRQALRALLKRATIDYEFRQLLLKDPNRAIGQSVGVVIPVGLTIRVVERDPGVHALVVLPDFRGKSGR